MCQLWAAVRCGYGASITEDNSRADAQFLRNALKGEDIVMKSAGTQLRTYCYLADCISGLLFILLCGQSGEAYNIANRDSVVTIRQYAQVLEFLFVLKIHPIRKRPVILPAAGLCWMAVSSRSLGGSLFGRYRMDCRRLSGFPKRSD